MNSVIDRARHLPDDQLIAHVKGLAARERGATAELVAHLAELEARGLHLAAGYGSMFAYCCGVLLLSEHEAYHRIEAARAVRRFPVILDLLAQGAVNLTTVKLLARHLTPGNYLEVLESARGLTRLQVEQLVARLAPQPDVPPTVRKLRTPATPSIEAPAAAVQTTASIPPTSAARPAIVSALSPARYKMQLTVTEELLEQFRLAKDLLRHALPSGDDAVILERALAALLTELMKKKFAASDNPRPSAGVASGSRTVPAEVKRAVFLRDLGRCAFVGTASRRCEERSFLEFHHVRAYAHGGPATVESIQLRCRRHNMYEWQLESAKLARQRAMFDG